MNILSRNTRLLLLATLLCLHCLAGPAWGEESEAPQSPAEEQIRKKHRRTDDRARTEVRHERNDRERQRPRMDFQQREQGGQRKSERQEQARSRTRVTAPRSFTDQGNSQDRRGPSADLGTVTPPADLMRLDSRPETAKGDHAFQRRDTDRRERQTSKQRQERSMRKSNYASRQDDRHDERREFRQPHFDTRREYRHVGEYGKRSPQVRHDNRHRPEVVKHVVHKIPSRHAVIMHGRDRYHYYSGRFYRPWNSGFILVRPPLGLVVLNIPLGSRLVISAGISYHVFGDVYYRRVPSGYQVVEPIRSPAAGWPARVEVMIDHLNVRYGPEASEEVIAQVDRYTILRVLGSAPGWLYVELEDEDVRGWVMEEYVTTNTARG